MEPADPPHAGWRPPGPGGNSSWSQPARPTRSEPRRPNPARPPRPGGTSVWGTSFPRWYDPRLQSRHLAGMPARSRSPHRLGVVVGKPRPPPPVGAHPCPGQPRQQPGAARICGRQKPQLGPHAPGNPARTDHQQHSQNVNAAPVLTCGRVDMSPLPPRGKDWQLRRGADPPVRRPAGVRDLPKFLPEERGTPLCPQQSRPTPPRTA